MIAIKAIIYLILLFLISCTHIQTLKDQWMVERFETIYSTKGIKAIEIRNQFGNIRTRGSDDGAELQLYAVTQHHKLDHLPVIQQHRERDKLLIEVVYPVSTDNDKNIHTQGIDKRRIDIAVFVPNMTHLNLQTSEGFIESKGHKNQLDILTLTGNIKISSKGMVNAYSQTGSINSTHRNRLWTGSSTYETQTGNIRIALKERPNVVAKVETGGTITTDYSIEIKSYPGTSNKTAIAHIGTNAQLLIIKSSLGNVELSRVFDMIHSKPRDGNRSGG